MPQSATKRAPASPTLVADAGAVALLKVLMGDLPAEEVRRYACSGTPSVRQAAAEVLGEMLEPPRKIPPRTPTVQAFSGRSPTRGNQACPRGS